MTWPWLEALDRTVLVPAELRTPTLDLVTAAGNLGCRTDELVALVMAGFPATDSPDGPRFDPLDVINLGLTSATGRSLAELSERRALKLATGDPAAWTTPRRSRVELVAMCGDGEHRSPPHRPDTSTYGGETHSWTTTGPGSVQAEVTTTGDRHEVVDRAVRDVYDEVFEGLRTGRYRFAWLPAALRATPEIPIARGALDCEIGSVLVARMCADAGLRTRTRTGFLLGLVGVEHSWTEVHLDGAWRSLDPVLAFLATRHPGTHPAFTEFCLGSTPSRRLAWDLPAGAPMAPDDCATGPVTVRCRQLPATREPADDRGER